MADPQNLARFVVRGDQSSRIPSWISAGVTTAAAPQVDTLHPPQVPADLNQVTVLYAESAEPVPISEAPFPVSLPPLARVSGFPQEIPSVAPQPLEPDPELLAELSAALANVAGLRAEILRGSERQMVELVERIARRVIGRELDANRRIVASLVSEGIEALSSSDQWVIRLGSGFESELESLRARFGAASHGSQIEIDAALNRFGCVIQNDLGVVDESVEKRLELVLETISAVARRDEH